MLQITIHAFPMDFNTPRWPIWTWHWFRLLEFYLAWKHAEAIAFYGGCCNLHTCLSKNGSERDYEARKMVIITNSQLTCCCQPHIHTTNRILILSFSHHIILNNIRPKYAIIWWFYKSLLMFIVEFSWGCTHKCCWWWLASNSVTYQSWKNALLICKNTLQIDFRARNEIKWKNQ